MNGAAKLSFWIFAFWTFSVFSTQFTEDYTDVAIPEFFNLRNAKPLILNETYCLNQISAEVLPSIFYGDHNKSLLYIKISWESKDFMASLKVESDSLNDSYCDSENKHYYYRKPLNQSVHVFPDDVNEGIRYLPIKLDCKYVITPELDGICQPIKLQYETPVCIDNDICSCRNVFIPGPELEAVVEKDGITVTWSFPKDYNHEASRLYISIYLEDGINIKKISKRKIAIQSIDSSQPNVKHKQYFSVNVTEGNDYRVQGYFENRINCHGNSTFFRFRYSGSASKIKYENAISYKIAFVFLFVFVLMSFLFLWKKQLKRICRKLFCSEDEGFNDVMYIGEDCEKEKILLPPMQNNPAYVDQSRDSYWFDYRDLVVIRQIASGNFGVVCLAYSSRSFKGCNEFAIKQIKGKPGPEGLEDFKEEINMFKLVGDHPNIVKMFGYCGPPQPLTIIMEYVPFNLLLYLKNLRVKFEQRKAMSGGSISYAELSHSRSSSIISNISNSTLDNYISQNDVENSSLPSRHIYRERELDYILDHQDLEKFGLQIARGMAHLEFKNIVHRDLAARNVLMDNFKNLKITDFGMSKTGIYVNKRTKKFPLRWMSPEALVNRLYSNKSDVWSYGVVLWEIGTLGAFPYPSLQNEEVISLLQKGGHLDKPENVSAQLYRLMEECWAPHPDDRPSFKQLVQKLEEFCQRSNGYVDFENLKSNYVFPPMEEDLRKKEIEMVNS